MKKLLITMAALVAMTTGALAAGELPFTGQLSAKLPCGPTAQVLGWLGSAHKEQQLLSGTTIVSQKKLSVYMSKTKTFTFVITNPQGITCLFASGKDLKPSMDQAKKPELPTKDF